MVERLLEGDVDQVQRGGAVLELLVERDVDATGVAEDRQDVAEAGVGELEHQQLVGGRIEQRRLGVAPRLLAHRLDGGRLPRGLEARAERLLEIGDRDAHLAVRRVEGAVLEMGALRIARSSAMRYSGRSGASRTAMR